MTFFPRTAMLVLCAGIAAGGIRADEPAAPTWIPLFNGKNLDGWTVKIAGHDLGDNHGQTFRVDDGRLRVAYDDYDTFDGRFGHLFYERPFSHYRLRVEYRFTGAQVPGAPGWAFRNSGVMIHGQPAATMAKDQPFPVSIEVQLLGGGGEGTRPTANLCTPGTHVEMNDALVTRHCTNSTSKTYHGDQWVTVEIEVRGDEVITHRIDGVTVLSYQHPQLDEKDRYAQPLIVDGNHMLAGGTISLQSEGHPVEFRRVELLPLQ
ncbi:MAG: DUF1080 domain-containing protein [Phycisphaerales bacterium]|nr:DUF1080 domain-containing protein [Phycisphaerae bacterium]NNM27133.1 DUF1080 domain-containing protein [Phycisphaerales bacterium]